MAEIFMAGKGYRRRGTADSVEDSTKRRGLAPSGIACGVYAAITVLIGWRGYVAAERHWIYPLDDPYIAMAMARSLALRGVWGITRFGFTSSSSTPLFTVLLALVYRVAGVNIWAPLAVSWLAGLASIFAAERLVARYTDDPRRRTLALVAFVVAAPLYAVGLVGMENSLHLLLVLLFLLWMDRDRPLLLALVSGLMVAARYEGLFVLFAACLAMAYARRWRAIFSAVAGAALPVAAYGFYSIAHGGRFLPNSVLIKGTGSGISLVAVGIMLNLIEGAALLFLVLALFVAGWQLWNRQRRLASLALVVAVAGALHLAAARIGSSFRYEAYIVGCAALVAVCVMPHVRAFATAGRWAFGTLLLMAACAACYRSIDAAVSLPQYARAVYLQQWQMARFLSANFPEASVAANDIGAISYFTDIHCTDLVGLADADVFAAKKAHAYTTDFVRTLAAGRGVQLALVYDRWFQGVDPLYYATGPRLPAEWVLAGKLTTPKPPNLGAAVVSFYAVDPQEAGALRAALLAFRASLPAADRLEVAPAPDR